MSSTPVTRCTVPGPEAVRLARRAISPPRRIASPGAADLELRPPLEHVPRLVLDLVELQAERLARLDEQDLAGVVLGLRPDQLRAPRLLDRARVEGEVVDPARFGEVKSGTRRSTPARATRGGRRRAPARGGAPSACSRSATAPRGGRRAGRPSAASSGNVVDSWSPRSGKRSIASADEDVDAAVHPVRDPAALAEAGDDVVVVELDDAERRGRPRDGDGRGRAGLAVPREQRVEVDVDAARRRSSRRRRPLLGALPGGELDPAAAAEPLGLLGADDLDAEPAELLARTRRPGRRRSETITRSTPAAARRPIWYATSGLPGDVDERLRPAARGVAEALGLPAREDDRLHYCCGELRLGLGRLGQRGERRGRRGPSPRRRSRRRASRRRRGGCGRR